MKISFNQTLFLLIFITLGNYTFGEVTDAQKQLLEQLPADQRNSVLEKINEADEIDKEVENIFENPETLVERPENAYGFEEQDDCEECIFGYEFFQFAPSTFAPTDNISIPADYVLGPGDKLSINFYGNKNFSHTSYISREGILNLPQLGPLNLLGLTFQQAQELLKKKVENDFIGLEAYMTLSELRSISVYILGQAYKPGKYSVSGLSTVTNALFVSGGVNQEGSLREIEVRRNDNLLGKYDFYEFILKGSLSSDIRLQDGDVIFIPFIENKIKVGGGVKRSDLFEFKEKETIKEAIFFAGGLSAQTPAKPRIELSSVDVEAGTRVIRYVDFDEENLDIALENGNSINIQGISGLNIKTVKVTGEVNYPGEFSINPGDTMLDIIERAGGYTTRSYPQGAVFLRKSVAKEQKDGFLRTADELEKTLVNIVSEGSVSVSQFTLEPVQRLITRLREIDPIGRQVVELDLNSLKSDPYVNFEVQDGDELFIPERPYSISVLGEVLNSSTLRYNPNFSVDDYISSAGGLTDQADASKIFFILPNGQAKIVKKSLFRNGANEILPGSTVVVTRDSKPWDAIKLTQVVTPILADLATSAAAIAAISDN